MHSNSAPNSSSSRDKDKKTNREQGQRIWPLCVPPLCTVGMVALKPTEVEVKVIELAQ